MLYKGDGARVSYAMLGPASHWCGHVRRCHRSNHVYLVLDFQDGCWCQKCFGEPLPMAPGAWGYHTPSHAITSLAVSIAAVFIGGDECVCDCLCGAPLSLRRGLWVSCVFRRGLWRVPLAVGGAVSGCVAGPSPAAAHPRAGGPAAALRVLGEGRCKERGAAEVSGV